MVINVTDEKLVATIEYKQRIGADLEFAKGAIFTSLENEPFTCLRENGRDWIQVQVQLFSSIRNVSKKIERKEIWSKFTLFKMF